jgi:cytochrome b subunit of formate dehydrogenase
MISFIVLVLSGFSLRFSESWWVRLIWGWQGGFALRGTVHRVSAVIMVFGAAWHLVYLFTERGRHWFRDMWMSLTDVRQVWQNLLFLLGLRRHEPAYKRFSYMEKAEYWALMWGTVIMTVTGLLLWFDQWASHYLPKGFLEVMLVIHYYEAWLATLAILVWHMYSVMFKPGVYPMNPAWLGGRMPKLMYDHEHADGPKLKVRTSRSRPEEEIEGDSSPPAQGAH